MVMVVVVAVVMMINPKVVSTISSCSTGVNSRRNYPTALDGDIITIVVNFVIVTITIFHANTAIFNNEPRISKKRDLDFV